MPGGTTVDAPVARAFLAASLAAVWAGCASAPCRMNSAPAIACAAPLVPADPAGLFAAGYYYHGPRRPARRAGGAHMSLQRMIVANASFAMPGIELGRGDGWAAVFAEEPCGIEAWIGQSRQDVVTPPPARRRSPSPGSAGARS